MKPLKCIKLNNNQNGYTNALAKLDFKVTLFLSSANLPSSLLSLSFQEPGTILKMPKDAGSIYTNVPYETPQPLPPGRLAGFEGHSLLLGKAMKLLFLFIPTSIFALYFGSKA